MYYYHLQKRLTRFYYENCHRSWCLCVAYANYDMASSWRKVFFTLWLYDHKLDDLMWPNCGNLHAKEERGRTDDRNMRVSFICPGNSLPEWLKISVPVKMNKILRTTTWKKLVFSVSSQTATIHTLKFWRK